MVSKALYSKSAIIAALLVCAAAFSPAVAQTGMVDQWIRTAGGTQSWSSSSNWLRAPLPGFAVPNQGGDIANIVADITANQLINLNGTVTIGTLNLGDINGSSTYTIGVLATTDVLNFDNSSWGGAFNLGGRAELNKVMGGADSISDVLLSSDLAIYNRVAFTIAGNITDGGNAKSLLKRGTNNLTLSGINSYSGDTIIDTTGGTVFLNTTGGNAISSALIRLGNSSYDGSVSTALTLQRSDQIADTSVIRFDGGSGRNAFFRLSGFNETIKGISDFTGQGVIENTAGGPSTLTLNSGGADSSYNGFLRNNGGGVLTVVKNDAGALNLSGGNINFTGGLTISAGSGTVNLTNIGSGSSQNIFGSDIANGAALELEATSNWIFSKVVSGSGTLTKLGTATVALTANQTFTGALTVDGLNNGTGNATGTLQLITGGRISASTPAITLRNGGTLSMINSTTSTISVSSGSTSTNTTLTLSSTAGLVPGMAVSGPNIPGGATIVAIINGTQVALSANATAAASGQTFNFSIAGANQTDRLRDATPITMQSGGLRFENSGGGSTFTESVGAVTLASGLNTITAGRAGGNTDATQSTLTLASLTRNAGSTLNFAVPDVTTGAALGVGLTNQVKVTTGLTLDDGIIGGWATVGNEWATYGANGVAALGASGYSKIIGGNTNSFGAGANFITVTDVTGIVAGMGVTASAGIANGTTVLSVTGNNVNLSTPTIGVGGNNPVFGTFANNQNIKLSTVTAVGVPAVNTTINFWMPSGSVVNSINLQDVGTRTFALNGREIVIGSGGILSSGANMNFGTNNASAGVVKVLTSAGHAPGFNELVINVGDSNSRLLNMFAQVSDNGATPLTLVKTGPGKLALTPFTTSNAYSGGTFVNGGSIEINSNLNLGTNATPNYLVFNGGAVELAAAANITIPASGTRAITIGPTGGRFELDQGETLTISSGVPVTGPGVFTLGAGDATGGTLNMNSVLSVQGGLNIVAGRLNLNNAANNFGGAITMSGGMLAIPAAGSIPSGLDLTMSGGTFRLIDGGPGGSVTIGALSGSSTNAVIDTFTSSSNPPADLPAQLIINQNSNTTFAGAIRDVFSSGGEKSRLSIAKTGSGILTLTNPDSFYRGTTTVAGGAIAVTKMTFYGQPSPIGFGDFTVLPNSADSLFFASGTSLIYVGSTTSITDRSFTMGTGSEGMAIYANGTTVGATLEYREFVGEQVQFDTPDVGATLTLGGRNTGDNVFGLKLTDNGAGATSLVKTGPGTWVLDNLNGSNDFTGSTTIYDGRLVITGDGALGTRGGGSPPVQLVGGVLDLRNVAYTAVAGDTEDLLIAGGRLDTSSGTSSWAGRIDIIANTVPNVNVGRDAQLTLGAIGGGGPLDKDNFGTLVLNGSNTFSGSTTVRDGTLTLDYTTSLGDNKLSNTSALILGGGRTGADIVLKNTSGTNSATEAVLSTTLNRGQHSISKDPGTLLGRAVIDLGPITRNAGATLDVESGGLARTVTNNNSTGLLGAWATVGHTSWAFKNETNNVTGFIEPVSSYVINNWVSTNSNTDVQSSNTQTNAVTNTLRFNQPSTPVIVTLNGLNTLQSAGILVTPAVNVVDQIQGGSLTIGPSTTSGGELVVQQFSTTAGFVIGSTIVDRVAAPVSGTAVQKLGPGVLALTGANTYTGITTIAGGTLIASSLTNGGLPSSLGQGGQAVNNGAGTLVLSQPTFAASNVVIGGGTLEYTGESTTINRSFTVKEFGALNVGDEDMTLTLAGDEVLTGVGSVVGDSGTAAWDKTGAGTLRLLRLESSGGASGIQALNIADGKLIMEYGYSTTPSTPLSPAPPNATDRLINTNATLTVSGGKLEFIGDDYVVGGAGSFQRFFSQFSVGTGASEIQVTSHTGLNPFLINAATLGIGDPNNTQDILREVGGTVLFVENPNGGRVTINLNTVGQAEGIVIPWATYLNKNNLAQPGVNNFAAIEQTDKTVVSADSKSLYAVKANPFDWNNDGIENITEGTSTPFGGANVSSNSKIATLRFFNDTGAGTLTLTDSLTLTQGAILVGANVKNNQKTITGGTLTSTYLPAVGQAELMIHNYNPNLPFRVESVIADPTSLVTVPKLNLVHTGTGTTSLFAANTYTGSTLVTGGVLKLENANAVPGGIASTGGTSALTLDGGQIGLTSASGNFTRALGTGINQVQWTSSGGFAAYGVDRSVNLGGNVSPTQVRWGVGGFVPSGDTLVLGAQDADKTLTFSNPIDLGVTDRLVRVEDGTAAEDAVLSGALSGGGSLTKNGEGALRLTATNTHLGGVTLAEGTLYVPSPSVLGSGTLAVGNSGNTTANDAPTLVLESGSIPNLLTVGNKNSAGITNIEVPNDVTLTGAVTLEKTGVFLGPDSGKTLTINSTVGGSGGFNFVDGGTVKLTNSNTYGSAAGGAGAAINGSTIIRNGTIQISTSTSLGDGTKAVELGDAMTTAVVVDRATTGTSLIKTQGTFDPTGNGVVGSLNGIGAFYNVSATLDGATYTAADVGKLILVKDEGDNPERNGVYKIVFGVSQPAGTMNLTRVDDGVTFPLNPVNIAYGTDVTVQNGTVNAGKTLFLAAKVDAPDINSDPFYWKNEVSLNPNVSLLISTPLAAPVTNPIDVNDNPNDTLNTGVTTIGFTTSVLHGTATLSGDITLQSLIVGAENKDLTLTASGCAELIFSGAITDPGAGDTLNLIKIGTGVVTLSGTNNFDGTTKVSGGVLKLDNASALGAANAGSGNLNINGGVVGLTTASGNFSRTLGTTGVGTVQWTGSGGFASYGTDRTATLSSGAAVTWGSGNFVATGQSLILGAADATAKATLTNPIALGTAGRIVNVPNGPAAVEGELSGVLSGGAGGTLSKTGQGTLLLSGINTYTAGTVLAQGTLQGKRTTSGSAFGSGVGAVISVGIAAPTQSGDALKLEFLGDTGGSPATYSVPAVNAITIGTSNSAGTTSIDATNGNAAATVVDVDVLGTVSLGRRTFIGPDTNAIMQFSGIVSGASGGITVVDGGTVRLTNNSNSFGTALGAGGTAIDGSTIIRDGTVEVTVANALGSATRAIELGDTRNNLTALVIDRASSGMALVDCGAVFSSGTYSSVPTDFGGGAYTVADIGKRLLVKDETINPERNGIYQISAVSGTDMTLVRATEFDANAEMIYGSTVQVTNGTVPNQNYFMASSNVATVNTSPVLWRETSTNPNVAFLAASTTATLSAPLTIANPIDLNAAGSTGTTTIGASSALTDLNSNALIFSGPVTMQSQNSGAESLTLDISSAAITNTATGVTVSGLISVNAVGADTLNVRKVGNGVATLSNPTGNTYNGTTTVNAGVLLVNNTTGSGTGTGPVTVNGIGTVLGGTGSVSGLTTINNGAILSPGTGISDANAVFDSATESLAFTGGLTMAAGSKAIFRLNTATPVTGYDQVLVTGTLSVDLTSLFQVSLGFTPVVNQQFNLFDWTTLNYSGPDLAAQLNFVDSSPSVWNTSLFNTQGIITYVAPEPSRMILLLLGAIAGLFHRRRKSRN